MDAKTFFLKMDMIMEANPGTLEGNEILADQDIFDSLSMLDMIIFLDDEFGVEMTPEEIGDVGSLSDLHLKMTA